MNTEEQKAVKSAVSIFWGTQGPLDREYEERIRLDVVQVGDKSDRKPRPRRFYSREQVELDARRADEKIGKICARFSLEQMAEYMRMTT